MENALVSLSPLFPRTIYVVQYTAFGHRGIFPSETTPLHTTSFITYWKKTHTHRLSPPSAVLSSRTFRLFFSIKGNVFRACHPLQSYANLVRQGLRIWGPYDIGTG